MREALIAAVIAAALVIVACVLILRAWTKRHGSDAPHARPNAEMAPVPNVSPRKEHPSGRGVRVTKNAPLSTRGASKSISRRFVGLSVLVGGIFTVLAAKLFSMQVLSGEEYASDAEENLYTTVSSPAARGNIYDVKGRALVTNRTSQTVLADAEVASDNDIVRRLSAVLGVPRTIVRQRIDDAAGGAQNQRVVASDVALRDVAFISEHSDAFPGVSVDTRTIREYPYGALAAHVLGYTGTPSEEQLKTTADGRDIKSTDTVGLSGIEAYYDGLLAGDHGTRRVMIDAAGNVIDVDSQTQAQKGSDIFLNIDATVQYVADKALANTIAPRGDIGTGKGVAGAVVALDVRDGSVVAMASFPTFDPSNFTGGIPQEIWDLYTTEQSHAPLNNRAVNGQYAAASTFKAFTSMAGLHYGFADSAAIWNCQGSWDGFNTGAPQNCWDKHGHGWMNLHDGITESCDVVFYEIAKAFYDHGPERSGEISETALQDYISMYNFGQRTGIDLVNESAGRVPTPAWKAEQWRNVPSEASWRGGDYTNMIIGQGDVLVTPLQVAAAYGGIATGRIMRPQLLREVHNAKGDAVVAMEPEIIAEPDVNPGHLDFVRNALRDMILSNSQVAAMFQRAGVAAAGKSGTAEHTDRADDAWFVAYGPYDDPRYVVACIIEQGEGGSTSAAPVVAEVLGACVRAEGADPSEGTVERVAGSSGNAVALSFSHTTSRTD